MRSPQLDILQDNTDSPQDPLPSTHFAFRLVTRLKSQQAL